MPSEEVYSNAEDRKQFHGELRESTRNGLPTNYWSFHDYVDGVSLRINISGVEPVSNSSEIFGPLSNGDELFVRDPAHFFPGSSGIRVIVTAEPASAGELDLVFSSSETFLSIAFVPGPRMGQIDAIIS